MIEEVRAVAETIKELYDDDDTYRFADDRELWQALIFRRMVPEDLDVETVRHARRMLQ